MWLFWWEERCDWFSIYLTIIFIFWQSSGTVFKAHKLILAACSKNFADLFESAPQSTPCMVILEATSAENMSALLEFMYKGEVHVSQEALNSFLKAAENLQVNQTFISSSEFEKRKNWIPQYSESIANSIWFSRSKVYQPNMDVWLRHSHSHMIKIDDTKEIVPAMLPYRWIHWNKNVIHLEWIQAVPVRLVLHHIYRKCIGRLMQHEINEINAALSANKTVKVFYAMDHEAAPKMYQNETGKSIVARVPLLSFLVSD